MATLLVWGPSQARLNRNTALGRTARSEAVGREYRAARGPAPAFNIYEHAEGYTVEAMLPGINPNDLEINLEDQVLTIRGEFKQAELPEGARYHRREQAVGRFERSFRFKLPLNANTVQADYARGILTLRLPKAEAVRPRRIEVQAAQPVTIEG